MFRHILVCLFLALSTINAFAMGGDEWMKASPSVKLERIARTLENIRSKGCIVRHSPEFFVDQIDRFYKAGKEARVLTVSQVLGLLATNAGEVWDC